MHALSQVESRDSNAGSPFSNYPVTQLCMPSRRWKAETVMLALTPDDEAPPVEYKVCACIAVYHSLDPRP
jgi:hypothetical protein